MLSSSFDFFYYLLFIDIYLMAFSMQEMNKLVD